MKSLLELNLRRNFITEVKEVKYLTALQRLYLSNNKIMSIERLSNMPELQEITLDNNTIEKQASLLKTLSAKFPSL